MTVMRRGSLYVAMVALLMLSLACGGGGKNVEPTQVPEKATTAPIPTARPSATPKPAQPEVAVDLGELRQNEEGGFSYRVVPGYEVTEFGGMVNMMPSGADPDVGPVVTIVGGLNDEDMTNTDLYEQLKSGTPMTIGDAEAITVFGVPGLAVDITGDNNGKPMQGRAALVMVTPTQQFSLLVGAPTEGWTAVAPYFDALLASVEFYAPTAPELTSWIDPGTYAYVNSNVVRDVTVYDGVAYAATLGGMVAWNLDAGYATAYTPLQGMGHVSSNAVTSCDIQGEERIVVGTQQGLSLFDPSTGRWDATPIAPGSSNVATSKITRLTCDREQRWLLIGYNGLGVLDLDAGDFAHFTTTEGLSWNAVTDIAVWGSSIWVASGYNGLSEINGGEVQIHNAASGMPDERANALAFGADGALWVGGSKGLMQFKEGAWTLYEVMSDIAEVEVAADGSVWIASAPLGAGRLCRFDPAAGRCAVEYQEMDNQAILALALDDAGQPVYGTSKGLYVFDEATGTATPYVNADLLASNFVDSLASAPDGMLWVGTDAGFQVLDPSFPDAEWPTYTTQNTPGLGGNWAAALATGEDGTVWAAVTNGDVSRYRDGQWESYEGARSYDTVAVDTEGRAWFGDDRKGIVVFDAAGNQVMTLTKADGLPSDGVLVLLADPYTGTIWIGTDAGVARYGDGSVELVLGKQDLPHAYIRALALDTSGALLIGANLSVVRYDGNQTEVLYNLQQEGYMDWLTTLAAAPDGRIWAGTANGLFYSDDWTTWTRMTTQDGLLTNFVSALAVDQYGTAWIGGGGSNFDGGGLLHIVP